VGVTPGVILAHYFLRVFVLLLLFGHFDWRIVVLKGRLYEINCLVGQSGWNFV
jgi:hypothetical protein